MSKSRSKAHRAAPKPAARAMDPRTRGLTAFRQGKYDLAINEWGALGPDSHPELATALAEALLRRALSPYHPADLAAQDLRRAVQLAPQDVRLHYHLGLAEHRAGHLSAAADAYARTAALGMDRRGLGYTRALAELERDPSIHLGELPWLDPHDLAALTPVQALLRRQPDECLRQASQRRDGTTDPNPMTPLWTGLAHLMKQDAEGAIAVLSNGGPRLPRGAGEVQRFYLGLACASIGDAETAERQWTEVARSTQKVGVEPLAQLSEAMNWLQGLKLATVTTPSRWKAALDEVFPVGRKSAGESQLRLALVAANRLAEAARTADDWHAAAECWVKMRTILAGHPELGPVEPILQNLALAYERLEIWEPAADAWSALLDATPRARGRKKDAAQEAAREARRVWIRNRALDGLRRVGRADKAIDHFRQAVKAEPDNLELRLDMVSALLANDQWVAARNEIARILKKNPCCVEALLLRASIEGGRWETHAMEMTLREAYRCDPEHPLARKSLAAHLQRTAAEYFNAGRFAQAEPVYAQALEIDPANTLTLAYLIQTEFRLRRPRVARKYLDLALATDDLNGLANVLKVLIHEHRAEEVEEVIARAATLDLSVEVLVNAGVELLVRAGPPNGLSHLPGQSLPPDTPLAAAAHELIERGIAAAEDEASGLGFVLDVLGADRIELGVAYAERLALCEPDNPNSQLLFAMSLAYGGQMGRALSILDKAERLARRTGDRKLRNEIAALREELEAPPGSYHPMLGALPPGMLGLLEALPPEVLEELARLDELPNRDLY